MRKNNSRECLVKVLGCGGVAFLALVAGAENLETYLFATGTVWIICGTLVAMVWGYEALCKLGEDGDE